jgi:hypothetical protein
MMWINMDMKMRNLLRIISEANEYPQTVFWLPTNSVEFLDPPDSRHGDDGWDIDDLSLSIASNGIESPLIVGQCQSWIDDGNDGVFVWNGNHRLAVAKKLGLKYVPCENVDEDETVDGIALTIAQIKRIGGVIDSGEYTPPA